MTLVQIPTVDLRIRAAQTFNAEAAQWPRWVDSAQPNRRDEIEGAKHIATKLFGSRPPARNSHTRNRIWSFNSLFDYRNLMANWLATAAKHLARRPEGQGKGTKYVDLAPTDEADPSGVYSSALAEATNNPRVMNIALTGPYGSGKSSIIKSFLKGYSRPALQISLAAFLPEAAPAGHKVTRQEIERSILQQMLYGADANRLPLSRFKRIQAPGPGAGFTSLFIALGLIACWHLVQKRDAIISGVYFTPLSFTNWFNYLTFAIGAGFIWRVAYHIHVASLGISLKSLSLKDIEITPTATTEESILNRHLDEIIYFFQSTKYDLVVIEDLDRFDNADIFVTLREINSLINANSGVKRPVRFLYALRDDMFVNTDRTKFFEFLIPVIPIINSSNSIDKVLEQGKRLSLETRLNPQFLRETSRHLNDLRLIQNIFNEYAIYFANLETDGETILDANKLLAVLIYKNVFPSDFENLHRGKGNLAEVLRSHDRCIEASEARCAAEISHLEKLIDQGEQQLPRDLMELRRIYAMMIVEAAPINYSLVGLNHSSNFIPLSQLSENDQIEEFLNSSQLIFRGHNLGQHYVQMSNFPAVAEAGKLFKQRKLEIERKSATFRDATAKKIQELRTKLNSIRMMKFNEVIRDNSEELNRLFNEFGENFELARYLVLEGYLDDTYYQYTSLFHKGRLSPNDNKYLIRIRSFSNPDPDFQIDNPNEVIAAMRDEDFSRNYVLNVKIVDCLLSDPSRYATNSKKLFEFIAGNFDSCEPFLAAYYARGVAVSALITGLTRNWPGFVPAAIASSGNLTHVARIMSHLSAQHLKDVASKHPALRKFASESLPAILALGIDFPPERLEMLSVETIDLSSVEAHPGVIRVLFDGGLYKLSIENLNFIFRAVLHIEAGTKLGEQNYTLLLEAGSEPLLRKVDAAFDDYLNDVLLRLPDNRFESVPAIQRILERKDVEFELVVQFLEKQTALLPSLDQVPQNYHAALFEIGKIEPTWKNCMSFLLGESSDATILTEFLNRDSTLAALAHDAIPDGDDAIPLRNFIVRNNGLSDKAYAAFVRALPRNRNGFPSDLSSEKTKILVDLERVIFSAANFAHLGDLSLRLTFVKNNLEEFFKVESECDLDDDFRESLLEADITDESRLKILRSMDLTLLQNTPSRAEIAGNIIARTGVVLDNLGVDAARAVIVNSRPLDIQITLFNMLHKMFDDQQVREILQLLPDPIPDIKPGWGIPTIKGSEVNLKFVTWLKSRGFISSWKQGGIWDNDIRMHLFRK